MNSNQAKEQVVVSMTSFPAAIPYAAPAVQSILNGSVLPDKVVLYLTFAQFGEKGLPQELLKLAESNPVFEIRNYDRDIRSYRKLIPALKDFPDAVIVTVDDDVAYHRHMLRDLLRLHEQMPDAVLAHRAMIDGGLRRSERQNKALVDEISATIILQSYMEARRTQTKTTPL